MHCDESAGVGGFHELFDSVRRPRRARLLLLLLRRRCRWRGFQGADQHPPPQVEGDGAARDVVHGSLAYEPPPSAAIARTAASCGHDLRKKWWGQRGRRRRRGEPASDLVAEGRSHQERRVRAGLPRYQPGFRRANRRQAGLETSATTSAQGLGMGDLLKLFVGFCLLLLIGSSNATREKAQVAHVRELEDEVKMLKNLSHPNIVRYIGTAQENTLNILLEFVPGGSIQSLLVRLRSFPEAVIRKYTKQLLHGLEYLHRNGFMHRDIKA